MLWSQVLLAEGLGGHRRQAVQVTEGPQSENKCPDLQQQKETAGRPMGWQTGWRKDEEEQDSRHGHQRDTTISLSTSYPFSECVLSCVPGLFQQARCAIIHKTCVTHKASCRLTMSPS